MVGGCSAELGVAAPWRARPGRRGRSPPSVLKEEEEAGWT
jgi:hypothetical protein